MEEAWLDENRLGSTNELCGAYRGNWCISAGRKPLGASLHVNKTAGKPSAG